MRDYIMKIVVDINHPAHVHYFKNFIWAMEKKGHQILITASDKDIALQLLDLYNFKYVMLGSYGKGIVHKIINLPILDFRMWKAVHIFDPDLFIGFSPIRASHVSWLMRKKTIALDDTEHAKWEHMLYRPFTDVIMTPECFQKDFGKKQIRYNAYTELLYLYPTRFTPNQQVLSELDLTTDDIFFIIRFVSFDANHDVGQSGIRDKVNIVHTLAKYGQVFITSESQLPPDLEQYRAKISPDKMHDLLYYSTLFVGESSTMASESACLGTHAVYINTLRLGYTDEEESKYNLVTTFSDSNTKEEIIIDKILSLLNDPMLREKGKEKRKKLLADSCDPTSTLIELVESRF